MSLEIQSRLSLQAEIVAHFFLLFAVSPSLVLFSFLSFLLTSGVCQWPSPSDGFDQQRCSKTSHFFSNWWEAFPPPQMSSHVSFCLSGKQTCLCCKKKKKKKKLKGRGEKKTVRFHERRGKMQREDPWNRIQNWRNNVFKKTSLLSFGESDASVLHF